MFSNAFRALTTPVWRSARTLVVFPGVKERRLLGEEREGDVGLDSPSIGASLLE